MFKELDRNRLNDSKYIEELKREMEYCSTVEQGNKLSLNSIYGALANQYFFWNLTELAECITLQGQDAIQRAGEYLLDYAKNNIHTDRELLTKLGVPEGVVIQPITDKRSLVYCDTDSAYFSFYYIKKALNYSGDTLDFIITIYEHALQNYLKNKFEKYVGDINGMGNYLDFEMETISSVGLWIGKKKYMLMKIWEDGNILKPSLKSTGVDIISSATPLFARKKLKDLVLWILERGDKFHSYFPEFVMYLKDIKKEFVLSKIEDISMSSSVNNYQQYILQDNGELIIAKGCPIHVRAAGIYNYLINKNKLNDKYELLKNGDKVKWYHTTNDDANVFAYHAGSHPYEVALDIDYNNQFEKNVLSLVNRILKVLNIQQLDSSLMYTISLF